jgi:hypothetical protein
MLNLPDALVFGGATFVTGISFCVEHISAVGAAAKTTPFHLQ